MRFLYLVTNTPLLQKGEIVKETQNMNMVTAIINNYEGKTRNKKIGYLGINLFSAIREQIYFAAIPE